MKIKGILSTIHHRELKVKKEAVVHRPSHKDWQAHRKGNPITNELWFYMQSNNLQRLLPSKSRWKSSLPHSGANKNSAVGLWSLFCAHQGTTISVFK